MGITVGYWGIRGLGAPLRMMCAFAGEACEDKYYGDFPTWAADKEELKKKNPLMNLPYVKDGDVVVTQSNSCLMYLGVRLGLAPNEPKGQMRDNQVTMEVFDLRNALIKIVYPFNGITNDEDTWKKAVADHFEKTVPTAFGKLEACLEMWGTPFFAGEGPAGGDFHAFEMIDQHAMMASKLGFADPLATCPRLAAFYAAFKAEPKLAAYFASPAYALECNNGGAGAWFTK
jgi:glutathione S-transferase